jgi:hypothetical protein
MKPPSFGAHPQIQSALLRDTDIIPKMNQPQSVVISDDDDVDAAINDKSPAAAAAAGTTSNYNSSSSITHQIPPSIAEHQPFLHGCHGEEYNNEYNKATNPIPPITTTDNQYHDDNTDTIPMPSLNRQISVRARERRRQQHKRHSTMEDLIQQLDAHEKTERERQEQFDAMQREEEERIMFEAQQEQERMLLEQQQQLQESQSTSSPHVDTTTTTQCPGDSSKLHQQQLLPSLQDPSNGAIGDASINAEETSAKRTSPLKGIKRRFKTFRRQRHQPQDNLYAHMNAHGVLPDNLVPSTKKKRRRQRASRFASSFFRLSSNNNKNAVAPTMTTTTTTMAASPTSKSINRPKQLLPNNYHHDILFQDRFDTTTGKPYSVFTAVTRTQLRAGHVDPDQVPPLLFLEEVAHLLSLLSAVAFSTLRNDLPYAESPLTLFEPGLPWPHVDPDAYKRKNRTGWEGSKYRWFTLMRFIIGASRTARDRTLYNAARPFRVIGNVSDEEIAQLQQARGPLAKVALVSMWIQELISREYQTNDSTGIIAAPILSRLYQFVSDGMSGYNQARKIASIPFPFAHAQLT